MHRSVALLLLLAACASPSATDRAQGTAPPAAAAQRWVYEPDLPVSQPPFREVHANWKQRIDQPYVFVEYTGPYYETGKLLVSVHEAMNTLGIQPSGPPFGLYYDDPGRVPADRLRSRACVPVQGMPSQLGRLKYDVLPSRTVAYAVAGGAYPEVPRCYPGIYRFMAKMGWVEDGPVREIYLVPPAAVEDWSQLMTEVQVPVSHGR